MPRFFCKEIGETEIILTGEDAKHIAKALRMKPGEELTVCDMQGTDYHCAIASADASQVSLTILETTPVVSEPNLRITLYQAMPKSDKMDWIIQKAVELGVTEIVPVLTRRCVARPDAKSMEKKLERYNKIALEAAKQSGRGMIPAVSPLVSFEEAVSRMKQDAHALLFYENAREPLKATLSGVTGSISFMIGSEGGFDPEEAAYAADNGVQNASLGARILRCETAPVSALCAILYETDNM